MEFDGGLTREQAGTVGDCSHAAADEEGGIDWIKETQSDPHYCRECFRLWKRSMGAQLAKAILTRRRSQCASGSTRGRRSDFAISHVPRSAAKS